MAEKGRGCLPRESTVGDGTFPVFESKWLVPPNRWPQYDRITLRPHVHHVIDQSSQGSCNPCASGGAAMIVRAVMGLDRVVFAQAGLYAFEGITSDGRLISRRSDSGMSLQTSLQLMQEVGCSPTVWEGRPWIGQYDYKGYSRGQWPKNWREIASRFKMAEWYDLPDWDHFQSARCLGLPIVYGCKGHAVVRIEPGIDLNSWGTDWGDRGIGQWATDREIQKDLPRYGAWANLAMYDPPADGDVSVVMEAVTATQGDT
jgi:hypothetical protein